MHECRLSFGVAEGDKFKRGNGEAKHRMGWIGIDPINVLESFSLISRARRYKNLRRSNAFVPFRYTSRVSRPQCGSRYRGRVLSPLLQFILVLDRSAHISVSADIFSNAV